jgi:hypothetical protein
LLAFLEDVDPTVPRYQINQRADVLLHKYVGREEAMFTDLREEYLDRLPQPPIHDVPSLQGPKEQEHLFPVYSTDEQTERLRPVVQSLLKECNPKGDGSGWSELAVTQLLLEHEGREHNLIAELRTRLEQQKEKNAKQLAVHPSSSCSPLPEHDYDMSAVFRPPLEALMQEFFPERIGEVENLLREYSGREAQMFAEVRNAATQNGYWEKKEAVVQRKKVLIAQLARSYSPERKKQEQEVAEKQKVGDEGRTKEQLALQKKLEKNTEGIREKKRGEHMDGLLLAFSNLDPTAGHRLSVQVQNAHVLRKELENQALWDAKKIQMRADALSDGERKLAHAEFLRFKKQRAAAISNDTVSVRRLHFKDFGGIESWQLCQNLEQSKWYGTCKVTEEGSLIAKSKAFEFTLHGLSPLPIAKNGDTFDYQAQGSYSIGGEPKQRCAVLMLNKIDKTWNVKHNEPPNFDLVFGTIKIFFEAVLYTKNRMLSGNMFKRPAPKKQVFSSSDSDALYL